ncbi:MAG: hypothetical protein HYR96_09695 [Deltaproteobacteria bacterium]|nr:hypothetical protein [Deltaproteobacteria bacterium]
MRKHDEKIDFLVVLTSFVVLSACSGGPKDGEQKVSQKPVLPTLESIQVDFVNNQCIACHQVASASNRHVALNDLSQIIEGGGGPHSHIRRIIKPGCPKQSFFLSILKEGKMPKPPAAPVAPDVLDAIEKWIVSLNPTAGPTCDDEPGGPDRN